ncbi:MAG: hypothetical protein ACI9MC_002185 [Kiritimatiellia bacterium]|jgi:hypothetical protein
MDLMTMFSAGGYWMYVILALDILIPPLVLIALVFAIVSRATKKLRTVALVFSLLLTLGAGLPLCTGLVGWQVKSNASYQAALAAPPEARQEIDKKGRDGAGYVINFGCCSTAVMGVPMGLALLLTLRRRKRWQEVDED